MHEHISPATSVSGAIQLPGDKSISHRYAMLAGIAEGPETAAIPAHGALVDLKLLGYAAL